MDKAKISRRISITISVLFILMAFLTILYGVLGECILPKENFGVSGYFEKYMDGWSRVMEDGTRIPISLPGNLDIDSDDTEVILENVLQNIVSNDAYLIFRTSKQDCKIYIDGVLRKEYNTEDSRIWGNTSPSCYLFIKLDAEDSGKQITIHTESTDRYKGTFSGIYYANYSGFLRQLFAEQGRNLLFALFMLIIGTLALMVSVVIQIIYKKRQKLSSLSLGVIVVSAWMVGNSDFRQFLFPNISVMGDITFLLVALMPIPFAVYMDRLQRERYRIVYYFAEILALSDFVICCLLYITGKKDFSETFLLMAGIFFLTIVIMIVSIITDLFRGYIREYWMTAVAIALASVVAVVQIMNYLNRDKVFDITIASLGILLMLFVAVFDTIREINLVEKERQSAIIANETKSKFLANMSHEIRTPINAVLGMNEMILRDSKEDNIRAYAKDVDASGRILLSIINDILDFSKIESGKLEIVEDEYDLRALLDRLYVIIRDRAKDKKLDIAFDIAEEIPRYLYGDEARIQQIIINFLTNAVKYTDAGNIILTMSFENKDAGKGKLIVSVSDTGIGIQDKDLDILFSSFERVDEKRNHNIEGTGLGLAITKRLVELMDGYIEVESLYGFGSTFTAVIPQSVSKTDRIGVYDIENSNSDSDTQYSGELKLDGVRILVADDIDMNLKVFTGFLNNTGARVDAVDNGMDALRAWRTNRYDIVFLDHMMPEMDGVECAKQMWKEREINPDTPVIMLTANAIIGMKEQYLELGFSDYLTKPFTNKQLDEMLIKYLPEEKYAVKTDNKIRQNQESREQEKNSDRTDDDTKPLIDKEVGMKYCCMDESFYAEMLKEFNAGNKLELLNKLYAEEDWENYSIQVHGLKSASLTVGAVELSERAKQLEIAVKGQDLDYIKNNHQSVMEFYEAVLDYIEKKSR
ncbi:MAG: response regulator [Wujia sp.]